MPASPRPLLRPAIAAALLSLAACATPTPYQPLSSASEIEGGYTDRQLAEDRYRVTFAGNMLTERERVESYLLFRSAELTLEKGYDWFLIVDHEMDHEIAREIRRDPAYTPWFGSAYAEWRPYWRYQGQGQAWRDWDPYHGDRFWTHDVDIVTVERFEATAEIKLGRGQAPAGESQYFDARNVIADIGPRVEYADAG